jgi:uncharacterized membrane protein
VRVIAVTISFRRLTERAYEKIRQAGRGMPAVLIRQLEALAKVVYRTTWVEQHAVLLEQAEMIMRSAEESVPEPADRADVRARYERVVLAAKRKAAENEGASDAASGVSTALDRA